MLDVKCVTDFLRDAAARMWAASRDEAMVVEHLVKLRERKLLTVARSRNCPCCAEACQGASEANPSLVSKMNRSFRPWRSLTSTLFTCHFVPFFSQILL